MSKVAEQIDARALLDQARRALYDLTYGDTKDTGWWVPEQRRADKVREQIEAFLRGSTHSERASAPDDRVDDGLRGQEDIRGDKPHQEIEDALWTLHSYESNRDDAGRRYSEADITRMVETVRSLMQSAVRPTVDAEPPQPSLYGRSHEETLRLAREVLGCAIPDGPARQGILWAKRFAAALLTPSARGQEP